LLGSLFAFNEAEDPWAEIGNAWYSVARAEEWTAGIAYESDAVRFGAVGLREEWAAFAEASIDLHIGGSRAALFALWLGGPNSGEDVWTFGLVSDAVIASRFKISAELYLQRGTTVGAGRTTLDGIGPFSSDLDARGYAWILTAHAETRGPTVYHLRSTLSVISGFEQTPAHSADGNLVGSETRSREFISFENIDDMLILDSNEWGLDIDNNIAQVKLEGGVRLSTGTHIEHDLRIIVKLAWARTVEDYFVGAAREDTYGMEFNLVVEHQIGEQTTVRFSYARLFGSDLFHNFNANGSRNGLDLMILGVETSF